MAGTQDNSAQLDYWNARAGSTWTEYQERLDEVFIPITEAAIGAAAPAPGEHAIDIGCGCGATVLELARRVGAGGSVLGLDISRPMLERARQRIAAAGLGQASARFADAATEALPAAADLLFSRFGVMFFADPAAAFANLRRAMKPGGRMLFACWQKLGENQSFSLPLAAAGHLLPPQPPPDPDAPGPFAFADPDRVRAILAEAGWRDVGIEPRAVPMRIAGAGQLDRAVEFSTNIGSLSRLLGEADDDTRGRVKDALRIALQPHDTPEGVVLAGAIWLVSARA